MVSIFKNVLNHGEESPEKGGAAGGSEIRFFGFKMAVFQFSFFSRRFSVSLKYPFSVFGFQIGCFSVFGKVSIHFSLPIFITFLAVWIVSI